jgi:hypothetical protein
MSRHHERFPNTPAGNDYDQIERQLVRAYIQLAMIEPDEDGFRTVALGRFGDVEARLTEVPSKPARSPVPSLWLEIFSCTSGATIDGCGCFDVGEHELAAAVEMILEATRRNQ